MGDLAVRNVGKKIFLFGYKNLFAVEQKCTFNNHSMAFNNVKFVPVEYNP